MNFSRHWVIATALGISVFCESMAYTYIQQQGALYYYSSSLLYLLAGLAICILPLLNTNKVDTSNAPENQLSRFLPFIFYGFLIGLFLYHVRMLSGIYKEIDINVRWADMIPVIQLSCKRFLHGIYVYAPTDEIKPGSINAYLPMMWMPFLPSQIFGFDPRWTTVTALFIALFIAATPFFKGGVKILFTPMLIAGISLFMVLNFFLMQEHVFWSMTEEGVVTAFYMLLGFALLKQNYLLIGVAMACCTLSRYALVPWIPVYLGYVFFTESRANFFKLFLTFAGVITVVFVLPYFIWDPLYFLKLPGVQSGGLEWFWNCSHIIEHKYYNVGLYKFFNVTQLWLMVRVELASCFLLPLLFILLAKKLQQRYQLNTRFIAYGSLKLSLICFYNFIPTPITYLFFPVTLISYVVLFDYLAKKEARLS